MKARVCIHQSVSNEISVTLVLNFGYDEFNVTHRISYTLNAQTATKMSKLIGRFWAQQKINNLLAQSDENRAVILEVTSNNIVTDTTLVK